MSAWLLAALALIGGVGEDPSNPGVRRSPPFAAGLDPMLRRHATGYLGACLS